MPRTEALKIYRDGREETLNNAAGKREYKRRLQVMAERQSWKCAICDRIMNPPTFDHQAGRGFGGSNRDDRTEDEKGWINAALCLGCNGLKASQRYHWVSREMNGRTWAKYVPNIREVREAA